MRRREFITLLGGAALTDPLAARAQAQGHIPRIVFFSAAPYGGARRSLLESFRQGLMELGYVEGRTLILDFVAAGGHLDRLPAAAADVVNRDPDVIVVTSGVTARAVLALTQTIPIVQAVGADPVRSSGAAGSLSRPGGNLTGLTHQSEELSAKLIERST